MRSWKPSQIPIWEHRFVTKGLRISIRESLLSYCENPFSGNVDFMGLAAGMHCNYPALSIYLCVLLSQHSNPFLLYCFFLSLSLPSIVCDLRNGFCQGPCSPQWLCTGGRNRVSSFLQSCLRHLGFNSYRTTCKQRHNYVNSLRIQSPRKILLHGCEKFLTGPVGLLLSKTCIPFPGPLHILQEWRRNLNMIV